MHSLLPLTRRRGPSRHDGSPRRRARWVLALGIVLSCGVARAEDVARDRLDGDDLTWMTKRHPEAARSFLEGEGLFAGARSPEDVERALTLLTAAAAGAPESSLAFRRKCQALTALGRHADAIRACDKAIYDNATLSAIRAMVGAYMSGTDAPTPSELGYAKLFARRVVQTSPDGVAGHAAHCDIALKLGDTDMLNDCADQLRKLAPDHYETRRVEAAEREIRPGWGVLAGWAALVALTVVTAVHALARRSRSLRLHALQKRNAGALALVLGLALARSTLATEQPEAADEPGGGHPVPGGFSKFPIDDADPKSSVPSAEEREKDPLNYGYFVMDLSSKAKAALKRGDHAAAARYFEAAAKAVPDAAVGFVRACEEYETLGDLDRARGFCAAALTGEGATLGDFSHYARLAFSKSGDLTEKEIRNLDSVVAHLVAIPEGRSVGLDIQCQLGVRLGDEKRLSVCAPALLQLSPDHPKSLLYGWTLAMHRHDHAAARSLADRAMQHAGLPQEIEQAHVMQKATIEAMPLWRKGFGFRDWRVGAAVASALAGLLTYLLARKSPTPGTPELKPPGH